MLWYASLKSRTCVLEGMMFTSPCKWCEERWCIIAGWCIWTWSPATCWLPRTAQPRSAMLVWRRWWVINTSAERHLPAHGRGWHQRSWWEVRDQSCNFEESQYSNVVLLEVRNNEVHSCLLLCSSKCVVVILFCSLCKSAQQRKVAQVKTNSKILVEL